MRILDRYILKNFLVNYLLALCLLLGLFIMFDLIVNIQDFAKGAQPAAAAAGGSSPWRVAADIFDYYLYQIPVIYQLVGGIVPLVAAGFTMVRMTRHNELTAMLASGVSLYRVAAPIIMVSIAFSVVHVVNQEFVISQPFVIEKLLRRHDEVNVAGSKNEPLMFVKDSDGSLLSATEYYPGKEVAVTVGADRMLTRQTGSFLEDGVQPGFVVMTAGFKNAVNNGPLIVAGVSEKTILILGNPLVPEGAAGAAMTTGASMKNVFIVRRDEWGRPINHTLAATAHWESCKLDPSRPDLQETWVLRTVVTEDDTVQNPDARKLDIAFRPTGLSPEQIDLILSKKAVDYLSSAKVHELAKYSPDVNKPLLYKIMHLRFTQPLMNIIMLLIGIPFLLTREPSRLVINIFICTVVSGIIFVATFVMFQLGGSQVNPLLAAWLPVLIFGPFAVVIMDTIKT